MIRISLAPMGAILTLAMVGAAQAQSTTSLVQPGAAGADPSAASRADPFVGNRIGGLFRGSPMRFGPGGRMTAMSDLTLNPRLTRGEVQGPGGLRLEALAGSPYGAGAQLWANSGWSRAETERRAPSRLKLAANWSKGFGVDTGVSGASLGAAVGYSSYQDDVGGGFNIDARGWSGSLNAGYTAPGGLYLQGSAGYAPNIKLNRTRRPGYFGPTSAGVRRARAAGASLQAGMLTSVGSGWEAGPFVSVDLLSIDMAAHVGRGGTLVGERSFGRTRYSLGAQGFGHWGALSPSVQLAYVHVDSLGPQSATSAMAAMHYSPSRRGRPIDSRWRDHFLAGAVIDGRARGFTWRAQFEGRVPEQPGDRTDLRTGLALSKLF